MCGFLGITGEIPNKNLFEKSLETIRHRGPDNQNVFFSNDISLGFARLSIQDISEFSNQPIYHPSKKFIMVFNGEIYNHKKLRKLVKSKENNYLLSRSNSDTITLIALIDELGVDETLKVISGMFAIAVYFFQNKELILVRDHFGQKPLFYQSIGNNFIFGSEIKAIKTLANVPLNFDLMNTILPLMQTHLPDGDRSIFKDIYSLMPGEIIVIKEGIKIKSSYYFKVEELISESLYNDLAKKNKDHVVSIFNKAINKSVDSHLISDVPVGTLFSAGLDSSIIGKIAELNGNNFRLGFKNTKGEDDFYYDLFDKRSNSSTKFANFKEEQTILNLPFLLEIYETINKPDGLILSNLTKFAKESGFKVLLNGDASDELFSGYAYFQEIYNDTRDLDSKNILIIRKIINRLFPSFTNTKYQYNSWLNYHNFIPNNIELFEPYLDIIQYKDSRIKKWKESINSFDFVQSKREKIMMAFTIDEIKNRLPRYLHRSDSYGMINSVEMRAPFLDLDFVKLAINTPFKFKISKFRNLNNFTYNQKYILKELAKKCNLPNQIIYRRKKGTTFDFQKYMFKIIKNYKFDYVSDLFSISEKRLKLSIEERTLIKGYPSDSLARYSYNILCLQVIADIFIKNFSPQEISNSFSKIINS